MSPVDGLLWLLEGHHDGRDSSDGDGGDGASMADGKGAAVGGEVLFWEQRRKGAGVFVFVSEGSCDRGRQGWAGSGFKWNAGVGAEQGGWICKVARQRRRETGKRQVRAEGGHGQIRIRMLDCADYAILHD